MPAMLDDPARPTIYRTSGESPFPTPDDPHIPAQITPRQVTLRDRVTIATLVPFSSYTQVPTTLMVYLCDQLNREIEKGDTYPMIEPIPLEAFGPYWFSNFGAVMLLGEITSTDDVKDGKDWAKECLGSFYVKPNYPGRSSHVCNGGFLVTDAARNRGVGRLMGEGYLEWAPMLGYTYSVFNLVYETNVASCRIWDALGFKRIGRVKGCGDLKSHGLVDALIYGRDLGPDGEDFVSEERFDKIKFYLKHGRYPAGADRAEKSRLRSAATHYKLTEDDRLMLKDKEIVSDPQRQYEIARGVHVDGHGGINKTTATIAKRYHWVRIKETVSLVIKNCSDCREMARMGVGGGSGVAAGTLGAILGTAKAGSQDADSADGAQGAHVVKKPDSTVKTQASATVPEQQKPSQPPALERQLPPPQPTPPRHLELSPTFFSHPQFDSQGPDSRLAEHNLQHQHQHHRHQHHTRGLGLSTTYGAGASHADIPLDPQMMALDEMEMRRQLGQFHPIAGQHVAMHGSDHARRQPQHQQEDHNDLIDPQLQGHESDHGHGHQDYTAMLASPTTDVVSGVHDDDAEEHKLRDSSGSLRSRALAAQEALSHLEPGNHLSDLQAGDGWGDGEADEMMGGMGGVEDEGADR